MNQEARTSARQNHHGWTLSGKDSSFNPLRFSSLRAEATRTVLQRLHCGVYAKPRVRGWRKSSTGQRIRKSLESAHRHSAGRCPRACRWEREREKQRSDWRSSGATFIYIIQIMKAFDVFHILYVFHVSCGFGKIIFAFHMIYNHIIHRVPNERMQKLNFF